MKRLLPLALIILAGCGLQPLYSGGGRGPVAQSLRSVTVAPIEGRAGWLVRTALEEMALASEKVARILDGKPPRKVIVVPDRLVNVVA